MELTSREQAFRKWMFFSALLYGAGGLAFALWPVVSTLWIGDQTQSYVSTNLTINPLFISTTASMFWNALAVSMMATITVCAIRVWKDPVGSAGYALAIVVAKFTSSAMAILILLLKPGELTHTIPAIIVITDLPLGLITLYMYAMARRKETRAVTET